MINWPLELDCSQTMTQKEYVRSERRKEARRVDEFARKHDLDFSEARECLARDGLLFRMSGVAVGEHLYQDSTVTGENRLRLLQEITSLGEAAIVAFDKYRVRVVLFPCVEVHASAFGGFIGSPWDSTHNIRNLREKFERSHPGFKLSGAGDSNHAPVYFSFGYADKK
ncbi:MAG: hypothetical protein Q7R56_00700 [Nanoarchaeota archaeon]|nr:hypothetical protein [Nanoarchaeota archaeon]